MMHLTLLGSGSAGNCALVETPQARLLIDGGFSALQLRKRLEAAGVNPIEIDAILVTHEHGDHIAGLNVWCKQFATPIYANAQCAEAIRRTAPELKKDFRLFVTGQTFAIKDLMVESFPVPHDAIDPVGFTLRHGDVALGFLTDLGFATKLALERVRDATTLVVEANHDERLLQEDKKRPWSTKQRIMSRHGHLSNDAAAAAVETVCSSGVPGRLRRVILGHLSRDCNSAELAQTTVVNRLSNLGLGPEHLEVTVAEQGKLSARCAV
jgi:phosphoribosyl 1,2-cyclic phosphodiesterase